MSVSKTPDPKNPIDQTLKASADELKVEAARVFGALAGRGLELKGLDMMMNPNKDVMSVPDSVKTMGAAGLKGVEGIATAAANAGNDAFKKLLQSGSHHSGPPSHGLHAQATPPDPSKGQVR